MTAAELCARDFVVVDETATISEAALAMRRYEVSDVLVAERSAAGNVLLGVVTDHDIAVQVVAGRLDPDLVTVGEIMAGSVESAREADAIPDVLRRMQVASIRRMPVVDDGDAVVGVISIDDIVETLARQLGQFADLILLAQRHGRAAGMQHPLAGSTGESEREAQLHSN